LLIASLLASVLLLAGCVRHSPLPREMDTTFGTVRLGATWNPANLPAVSASDTVVTLPAGALEGGGRVAVYRSAEGTARRIWRDYPQSVDFVRLSGDLRRRYGLPTMHDRPSNPEGAERVVWEDPRTRLELVRDPRRSVATVYSLLVDRLTDQQH
jgi:hypothetical protein